MYFFMRMFLDLGVLNAVMMWPVTFEMLGTSTGIFYVLRRQ